MVLALPKLAAASVALLPLGLGLASEDRDEIFVRVDDGMQGEKELPFHRSWQRPLRVSPLDLKNARFSADELPSHLKPPDFIEVYDFAASNMTCSSSTLDATSAAASLLEIGAAAREIVDSASKLGVLFRNLHYVIKSPDDFKEFWRGCSSAREDCSTQNDCQEWVQGSHDFYGHVERSKMGGVDLATSYVSSQETLPLHNELVGNPRHHTQIGFFCLQNAKRGGESLLAKNSDVTKYIHNEIIDYVKEHGGVRCMRTFRNEEQGRAVNGGGNLGTPSWQSKCGTNSREEATKCFIERGFDDVKFDSNGNARVVNTNTGFLRDEETGDESWFNALHFGRPTIILGDGSSLPVEMLRQLVVDVWKATAAVKLRPGDFLLLNNEQVMHGRLPFMESQDRKRTLLTVYTVRTRTDAQTMLNAATM